MPRSKRKPAPPTEPRKAPPALQDSPQPAVLVEMGRLRVPGWSPRTIDEDRFNLLCRSIETDPDFLWLRPVLADANGMIFAGAMRYRAAAALGLTMIPAVLVDIPPELAKERALRDNSHNGEWDEERLRSLLAEVTVDPAELLPDLDIDALLALTAAPTVERWDDIPDENPDEIQTFRNDMRFPGAGPYDIPELRADMLYAPPETFAMWYGDKVTHDTGVETFCTMWGADSLATLPFNRGIVVGFYVDDYRFEILYLDPARCLTRMKNANTIAAITPNFSIWSDDPRAFQIYQTYKARHCGRYLQEAGIPVIPDVNWGDVDSLDITLQGIPKGAPAISVQLQTLETDEEQQRAFDGLVEAVRRLEPQELIVVGGNTAERIVARAAGALPRVRIFPNRVAARRAYMERGKTK